jgi:hypothetical protein
MKKSKFREQLLKTRNSDIWRKYKTGVYSMGQLGGIYNLSHTAIMKIVHKMEAQEENEGLDKVDKSC